MFSRLGRCWRCRRISNGGRQRLAVPIRRRAAMGDHKVENGPRRPSPPAASPARRAGAVRLQNNPGFHFMTLQLFGAAMIHLLALVLINDTRTMRNLWK
ncbi:hypothetical protein EVAR_102988_1 [Eumeta japonica]|uniref:Uncharacterized protein n=1 Tax=Eumeta variegata TaxID=151549 RepID=A0A4C1UPR3_EUMVA|nr:hypothetical protein EVAR_102988_1 [Eumeta japonica]